MASSLPEPLFNLGSAPFPSPAGSQRSMDVSVSISTSPRLSTPQSSTTSGTEITRERIPGMVFWLLVCVILFPIELSISLGGMFLTASKVFLVFATFIILPRLSSLQLRWYDWCMFFYTGWMVMAYFANFPFSQALEAAGFFALETLIVYLVARIYLRSAGQILATIKVLFWMVAINAVGAIPEAITGKHFIHEFFRGLTGFYYPYSPELRMGIHRSVAFFEHSILLGVFCASMLSLVWFTSTKKQRMWKVPVIFTGTMCAASSAPLLVFVFQFGLIGIERLTRDIKNRLSIAVAITTFLVITLENLSNRGFVGLLSSFVMNPQTTYMRKYQWQYAIDDVMQNWFLGFVPATYTRPNWMLASIDNYWLLIMMKGGLPALGFLFATLLLVWLAIAARKEKSVLLRNMCTGWGLMMVALLLTGSTVAFFGKLQPLFAFFIGLGGALAQCSVPASGVEGQPDDGKPDDKRGIPYTRFARNTGSPNSTSVTRKSGTHALENAPPKAITSLRRGGALR